MMTLARTKPEPGARGVYINGREQPSVRDKSETDYRNGDPILQASLSTGRSGVKATTAHALPAGGVSENSLIVFGTILNIMGSIFISFSPTNIFKIFGVIVFLIGLFILVLGAICLKHNEENKK